MPSKYPRVWRVKAGTLTRYYFTEYHAEQFACAARRHLPLYGVPVTVDSECMLDDALTRLTALA